MSNYGDQLFNPEEEHPPLTKLYETAETLECPRCADGSKLVIRIRRADGSNEPFFSCPNFRANECRESLNWTGTKGRTSAEWKGARDRDEPAKPSTSPIYKKDSLADLESRLDQASRIFFQLEERIVELEKWKASHDGECALLGQSTMRLETE